ncbi:MAG: hypothetical protein DME19_18900 [Verrucomicrobia bacterium]|nr:MAG: hypothetical protein DME19_18900 [Verrucomicrobiota bacterium]
MRRAGPLVCVPTERPEKGRKRKAAHVNSLDAFRSAMAALGLHHAGPIIADGKLRRFKCEGDRQRNSWYVLHPGPPMAGAFGCWKWQETERERERLETERHAKARKVADWILSRSNPAAAGHPYLTRKRVRPSGPLRQRGDLLVVPLRDVVGELQTLQFIAPDKRFGGGDEKRDKTFLSGGQSAGSFFTLADNHDGPLVICEGYATGASIHEATDFAVVCAMNCGNLLAVAQSLRAKWPEREIIIAADNDAFTTGKDGKPWNPGLNRATEAAKVVRAKLAVPHFDDLTNEPTDFNDVRGTQGLAEVKRQIGGADWPKETDGEMLQRLTAMPLLEYERQRESAAHVLGCRTAILDKLVESKRPKRIGGELAGRTAKLADVGPWDKPVDGDELLAEIVAFYEKYCCLPASGAVALAVWSLLTWCYELFDFAAILAVWSPEHACGKGRVLDVTEKIVRRPFRTSNTSAAVLYHVISRGKLTVLVDELDSVSDEQRAAICNILKGGYQSNGTAHRMTERNGEQVEIEFSTRRPAREPSASTCRGNHAL